ncbi:MAG: histidine phosphatase family protein [Acidobacteriota bacterium]
MKELIWMRHGKSDWNAAWTDDAGRALRPRGQRAAATMGRFLAAAGLAPDRLIASHAVRARDTAEGARVAGGFTASLEIDDGLYAANLPAALDLVRRQNDELGRLMVVGHEPIASGIVATLSGARVAMVTAAIAVIDLEVEAWSAVTAGCGRLRLFLPPRPLSAALDD